VVPVVEVVVEVEMVVVTLTLSIMMLQKAEKAPSFPALSIAFTRQYQVAYVKGVVQV